jgi:hypothetical protein
MSDLCPHWHSSEADDSLNHPTNDFERSVGAVLKEKGYEVVAQVGVAGFFIDLAVKHPSLKLVPFCAKSNWLKSRDSEINCEALKHS